MKLTHTHIPAWYIILSALRSEKLVSELAQNERQGRAIKMRNFFSTLVFSSFRFFALPPSVSFIESYPHPSSYLVLQSFLLTFAPRGKWRWLLMFLPRYRSPAREVSSFLQFWRTSVVITLLFKMRFQSYACKANIIPQFLYNFAAYQSWHKTHLDMNLN